MIKFDNLSVTGFEPALRGMRNPKNSWYLSDSTHECDAEGIYCPFGETEIGPNDKKLAMQLSNAGPVHGKFKRMMVVYLDITAPLYWWKEFDTYKVGTVANSCSTMHKLLDKEFTAKDFSYDQLFCGTIEHDASGIPYITTGPVELTNITIDVLNRLRKLYCETLENTPSNVRDKDAMLKKIWYNVIQLLPSSYNQRRTVMLNYEVLTNIYKYRKNHKLDEWVEFCKYIETLPHSYLITGEEQNDNVR